MDGKGCWRDNVFVERFWKSVKVCGGLSQGLCFGSDAILQHLACNSIEAVIPPKSNRLIQRAYDKHLYKNRNLVERFFCRIKQFSRIATRYDKLAERFASFVPLAAAVIWLA
jgi:hypothetical protein